MKESVSKKEYEKLLAIAKKSIWQIEERGDLEQRMSDREDFFETAVWCIKDLLISAYELGKQSAK